MKASTKSLAVKRCKSSGKIIPLVALFAALAPLTAAAQTVPQPYHAPPVADGTALSADAEREALIARTKAEMAANGKHFLWQPLLRDGTNTAAIEYWAAAQRPAVHTGEAEYFTVLEGTATLVTGGTLVGAQLVRPGFVDGDRIEGGASRMLHKGDVILVPRGVPHWFGIPSGQMLVLLGVKIPTPAP
jgi:mannose-6-phosphate isomerase-like protein (cupin superfamily)